MDATTADRIRTALERNARAVSLRPGVGQGTAVTRVRLREGLRCEVEDGPWRLVADMSPKSGGNDAGPNPGVLGRGALGTCLAIGYAMWAARRGVPISDLAVDVEADYDVRGELGVDEGVRPDYPEVRCVVYVESEAPEREVVKVLREAEAHSSYWWVFGGGPEDPRRLHRETWIWKPEPKVAAREATSPEAAGARETAGPAVSVGEA